MWFMFKWMKSGFLFFGGALVLVTLVTSGCSSLLTQAGRGMAHDFATAVQNEDDPQLVREAAPAYLLMMDALLLSHPHQIDLLQAAATLNSAYAGAFISDPQRLQSMSAKALQYGLQALCLQRVVLCAVKTMPLTEEKTRLQALGSKDLPVLMMAGTVWAGWIQAHSSDWNAIADLPRVQAILERIIAIDSGFSEGRAHLYLGAIETLLPGTLGGRQAEGTAHLQLALRLSGQQDLMAKVILAKQVARAQYDRVSHDRWLHEVVAADPHAPGWTLENCLAQEQARQLLKSADDYF